MILGHGKQYLPSSACWLGAACFLKGLNTEKFPKQHRMHLHLPFAQAWVQDAVLKLKRGLGVGVAAADPASSALLSASAPRSDGVVIGGGNAPAAEPLPAWPGLAGGKRGGAIGELPTLASPMEVRPEGSSRFYFPDAPHLDIMLSGRKQWPTPSLQHTFSDFQPGFRLTDDRFSTSTALPQGSVPR